MAGRAGRAGEHSGSSAIGESILLLQDKHELRTALKLMNAQPVLVTSAMGREGGRGLAHTLLEGIACGLVCAAFLKKYTVFFKCLLMYKLYSACSEYLSC
jgi:hypothetical protein